MNISMVEILPTSLVCPTDAPIHWEQIFPYVQQEFPHCNLYCASQPFTRDLWEVSSLQPPFKYLGTAAPTCSALLSPS